MSILWYRMMRSYRSLVIGAIIGMASLSVWAYTWTESSSVRIHQHLQPGKVEGCTHDETVFCTHLPIVSIKTNGQKLETQKVGDDKRAYRVSNEIIGEISVIDNPSTYNHLEDERAVHTRTKLKYRGNSSMSFDKKSYKLNWIHEDLSENRDENFLGMGRHDEWVLNGPFLDKTLIRNYMCMNIAGEIMESTPDVRFCEVFVDEMYQGVYVAMENVAKDIDRVDLTTYKKGDPFTSYIVRADRQRGLPEELNNFTHYANRMERNTVLEVIYPREAVDMPELKTFIERDLSKFEKALYSYDYDDKAYGYRQYIDVESFVDYFIINEFFKNYDAGVFSTYLYKDIRGKLHIGPVWDFNNAADNFIEVALDEKGMQMVQRNWYLMLMKDEDFVEAVIRRYDKLREGWLNEEVLLNYIDETVGFLGEATERNNVVWGYSFDPTKVSSTNRLKPIERNLTSYEMSISQLKNFIIQRGRWLDQHIHTLRQYAHESRVKQFNH
ncbi:MAG: CotH kinase family protein [Niameybacter sp.]